MPCSPAWSPSSQAQGHTHWFSSRSRVKLELKAGMTKLTWARWTGCGWGEGRGRVNLGRPEGGNWGVRGTPGQGVALGKGGPSPAAVGTIDFAGRCFAQDPVPSLGSVHTWAQPTLPSGSGHGVQQRGQVPAHPLWGQSRGQPGWRGQLGLLTAPGQALPDVGRAAPPSVD